MAWTVDFESTAARELSEAPVDSARRLLRFTLECVAELDDPRSIGKCLGKSRVGDFWTCRVGPMRLIAQIEDEIRRIVVVHVSPRRPVIQV